MSRSQVLGYTQHESSLRSLLVFYHYSFSGRNLLLYRSSGREAGEELRLHHRP